MQRLVIIPTKSDQALINETAADRAFRMADKHGIPPEDPRAKPYVLTEDLLKDPALLPNLATLVILHHGNAPLPGREPVVGGLTARELYDRLELAGWPQAHRGRVVFHSCMTGMRRAGLASFVDLFSNIVYSHGRRNPIKGYKGSLLSTRVKGDPSKKHTRTVLKGVELNDAAWIHGYLNSICALADKAHWIDRDPATGVVWQRFKAELTKLVKLYNDAGIPVPGILERAETQVTSRIFGSWVRELREDARRTAPTSSYLSTKGRGGLKQITRYEDWQGQEAPKNLDPRDDEKGVDVDSIAQEAKVGSGTQSVSWYVHSGVNAMDRWTGSYSPPLIWDIGPKDSPVSDPLAADSYAIYLEFDQKAKTRSRDGNLATGTLTPVAFADASTGYVSHSQFVYVVDDQNKGLGWVKLSELIGTAGTRIDALTGLKENRFTFSRRLCWRQTEARIRSDQKDKFATFQAVLKSNWSIVRLALRK